MSTTFQRITPFLWFHDQAEAAVELYVSIFEEARVVTRTHYNADSASVSGRAEGSLMTIAFELAGQSFTAINGGPHFTFNEAVSLVIQCNTQQEVDHYWDQLSAGGDPRAQQCGWLKDRFGLSWQVVPVRLIELLTQVDGAAVARVTQAMLGMKKMDLATLEAAAEG